MIGNQIENYKIISLLGEGGMANVYLAQHQSLGSNVAIKLLKEEYVQNSNIRKRFLAEARNLAKMSHPNIIKVTDLIDAGDIVAFVMEYIEGQTLEDFLIKKGKLTSLEIEGLFNQMILAVEYVHGQGLIHRDIKPSNFMVTKNGQIKLLDFGIAKNTNEGAVDYTKTGLTQQMGTPLYMSPEQVRSTSEVTKETDIYSLGVVLWQMVTGQKPYDSSTLSLPEIQVSILKEKLPLTNTKWDLIITNLMQKEVAKRSFYKSEIVTKSNSFKENKKKEFRNNFWKYKFKLFILIVFLFISITLFVFHLIFNQPKNPNKLKSDLDEKNLKGKVKTLISIEDPRFYKKMNYKELKEDYTYEEYLEYLDCRDAQVIYDTSQFDYNGNRIYHSCQNINPFGFDKDYDELIFQKIENVYDKNKQLISEKCFSESNVKYMFLRKMFYENGYLISENDEKSGRFLKFKYDNKGNLKSVVNLNEKNIEISKRVYFYNKRNLCVKMICKTESENEFYTYNSSNKMIKKIQKHNNTTIEERYNSNGDKVYEKRLLPKMDPPEFISYYVYSYSYDENNNWIKQTCKSYYGFNVFSLSNEIKYIIKRKFIYFK